jgi:hypothetical protein
MPPPRAHAHRLFCRGQEWYGAIILKWAGDRALIHYIGWQTMWNEWFSREDMMKRTRPLTANPRFGILATKDERNRVKRCLNLADELWGAGHDDSGGVEGGPGNGGGDRKDDEGSDEGDAAASNAEEGGSPREEQDEGGGGQPVDAQRALLDFVASLQGQQERADTAHEIEQSAAVARDVPDAPLVVVGASQEESEQEESDESDEDGSMSETESDEETKSSSDEVAAAGADGSASSLAGRAQAAADSAGGSATVAAAAVAAQALAASDGQSLHSSMHAFNGAISALDKKLLALGIKLVPLSSSKDGEGAAAAAADSAKAERLLAANQKEVQKLGRSELTLLFNRALCHHYSRHYAEAAADFDLVLHKDPDDIE